MSNEYYNLSGFKAEQLAKIKYLDLVKDNLYYGLLTRNDTDWGSGVLIGVEDNTILSGNVKVFRKNVSDNEFEILQANENWLLLKNKSTNNNIGFLDHMQNLESLVYKIYQNSSETKIRKSLYSEDYKYEEAFLRAQGNVSFNDNFSNLTLFVNTNDDIKITGIDNYVIDNINNGVLNISNVVFDLCTKDKEVILEGLNFSEVININNNKVIVWNFPTEEGNKKVVMSNEKYNTDYLIFPDTNIDEIFYSFSNNEIPPPINHKYVNDPLVTDSLFLSDAYIERMQLKQQINTNDIQFCRKTEDVQILENNKNEVIGGLNYIFQQDYNNALKYNCDSLYLSFEHNSYRIKKIVTNVELNALSGLSAGDSYLVKGDVPATGNENKVAVYNGSSFDFLSPINGEIGNVYDENDENWLKWDSLDWIVDTTEGGDYFKQIAIFYDDKAGDRRLLYLTNIPRTRIIGNLNFSIII